MSNFFVIFLFVIYCSSAQGYLQEIYVKTFKSADDDNIETLPCGYVPTLYLNETFRVFFNNYRNIYDPRCICKHVTTQDVNKFSLKYNNERRGFVSEDVSLPFEGTWQITCGFDVIIERMSKNGPPRSTLICDMDVDVKPKGDLKTRYIWIGSVAAVLAAAVVFVCVVACMVCRKRNTSNSSKNDIQNVHLDVVPVHADWGSDFDLSNIQDHPNEKSDGLIYANAQHLQATKSGKPNYYRELSATNGKGQAKGNSNAVLDGYAYNAHESSTLKIGSKASELTYANAQQLNELKLKKMAAGNQDILTYANAQDIGML